MSEEIKTVNSDKKDKVETLLVKIAKNRNGFLSDSDLEDISEKEDIGYNKVYAISQQIHIQKKIHDMKTEDN